MSERTQPVNPNYNAIRAALIRRGSSIPLWAESNNFPVSTVYDAARGARTGKASKRILKKLEALLHE